MLLFALSCARPVADFRVEGEEVAPAEVSFLNESERADRYEWDFGDGSSSSLASPTHRYASSGNYLVRLKAIKDDRSKIKEKRIIIQGPLDCLVEIQTVYGNILLKLYNSTPRHRDNFIELVEQGFYDSLLFHRVIEGFMIQGGDPQSKDAQPAKALGGGGPGYDLEAEFVDSLIHKRGAVAAARLGDAVNPERRSSGSQFYIVQGSPVDSATLERVERQKGFDYSPRQRASYLERGGTPFLDREYTVFGEVIEGFEVLDRIAEVATDPRNRPREDILMRMRIVR